MSITDGDMARLERQVDELAEVLTRTNKIGHQITAERDALKAKLGQVYRQQAEELDLASDAMEWAANERDKIKAERDAAMQDAKRFAWLRRKSVELSFDHSLIGLLLKDVNGLDGAMEAEHEIRN